MPSADITQSIDDAMQQADVFVFCASADPSPVDESPVLSKEKEKAAER
jgi:hypothetical protein